MAHDVLPRLRIGKDELVRGDPDNLSILAVQLEDVEGKPARHESVAVADARGAHPYWPRELSERVEEDVVDDMAQEVNGKLGRAARVSCGTIPGLRDGGRGFYPACV